MTGVRIKLGKEFRGERDFLQDSVNRYSWKFGGNGKERREDTDARPHLENFEVFSLSCS